MKKDRDGRSTVAGDRHEGIAIDHVAVDLPPEVFPAPVSLLEVLDELLSVSG